MIYDRSILNQYQPSADQIGLNTDGQLLNMFQTNPVKDRADFEITSDTVLTCKRGGRYLLSGIWNLAITAGSGNDNVGIGILVDDSNIISGDGYTTLMPGFVVPNAEGCISVPDLPVTISSGATIKIALTVPAINTYTLYSRSYLLFKRADIF